MSNPFDQFGADIQAALPPQPPSYGAPPQPSQQQQPPMSNPYGAPPAAPPVPPMENPYGAANPYGAPSPHADGFGGMGAPPGQPMAAPPADVNPFGEPTKTQPPPSAAADPWAAPPAVEPAPPAEQQPNPYGMPQQQYGQQPFGAPPTEQPPAPYGAPEQHSPNPYGAPEQQGPYSYGAPAPMEQPPANPYEVPAQQAPNPYGAPPPGEQPPANPYGAPEQQAYNPYGVPEQQAPNAYGPPPPQQQPPNPYDQMALVPSQNPTNPYAAPPGPAYGGYGGQPAYGAPPPPAPVDPFSVFESQQRAPEPAPESTAIVPVSAAPAGPDPNANDDDFWGSFGTNNVSEEPAAKDTTKVEEEKKNDEGLPPGGEWYDARIFTPTLGVMFFKPQELTDSLFLNTDKEIVDGLGERPVVAFIVEGSSARSAGVELGHVLLKVNGVDVRSPKEASRLIKEGPRPLPLLFYIPNTDVVIAEGEHMVKYDTRETTAPHSAKDWKPKYVVIGGIIAQPWMMNMYRSKSEYDIAVIETQARRPVSVKVKQFSLQGARIQNDWQGPQMVKYKNKLHPWKFIVVLPVARNPIKISSPNLSQLKPVHEGIRRVLLAQQRGSGRGGHGSPQHEYSRQSHTADYGHQSHPQQQQYSHAQQQSAYGY